MKTFQQFMQESQLGGPLPKIKTKKVEPIYSIRLPKEVPAYMGKRQSPSIDTPADVDIKGQTRELSPSKIYYTGMPMIGKKSHKTPGRHIPFEI